MTFKFMLYDIASGINALNEIKIPHDFINSYKETTAGIKALYDSIQLYADISVKHTS